jgi:uncharacterized protein (TIGR02118 family)
MAQLIVIYKTPKDATAFDRHYAEVHVPLAKKIPGLRRFETSAGAVSSPSGPSEAHLVVTLTFDSMAAIAAAFASPEGQAAGADIRTFATGGAEMMFFETKEV